MAGEQQLPSSGADQSDGSWRFVKERGGWCWKLLDAKGVEVATHDGYKTKKAAVQYAKDAKQAADLAVDAHVALPPVEEGN